MSSIVIALIFFLLRIPFDFETVSTV